MKKLFSAALLLLASSVAAQQSAPYNEVFRQFTIDVTATAQGFYVKDKVVSTPPVAGEPQRVGACDVWVIINKSLSETAWIRWNYPGGTTLPVAIDDSAGDQKNQMEIPPGTTRELAGWVSLYLSIIGTGAFQVRFEQTCVKG